MKNSNDYDYVTIDKYVLFRFRAEFLRKEGFLHGEILEADPGEILRARWEYNVLRADRVRPSKGKK